jgi:cellulose biosynthesis protein BcsQ
MNENIKKNLPAKAPRIMIYNTKGGVGKTALALNFALTFNYGVVTNDRSSIIDDVLLDNQYMILDKNEELPKFPKKWPLVFDFGGYPDKRALDVLKICQFIIIPVLPHDENIQTSLDFIQELKGYKDEGKIIIAVNQTTGKQYDKIKRDINYYYPEMAVFNIKKSTAFRWLAKEKKSIQDLAYFYKLHSRHFKIIAEQFNHIARHLIEQ